MTADDSPFEPGSPEDFRWVNDNIGSTEALCRQMDAAAERIIARQTAEEETV